MLKPKVALVKDGFLPPGSENKRGRLSAPAIQRCKDLASTGLAIEGYTAAPKADKTGAAPIQKAKPADPGKEIADIGDPFRDEDSSTAYVVVDGKNVPVGMRTVDNLCGNSLTYCFCSAPVVNIGHLASVDSDATGVVYFKPKN